MPDPAPQFFSVTADTEMAARWRAALEPLGGTHTAVEGFLSAFRQLSVGAPDIILCDRVGSDLPLNQLFAKLRLRAPGADLLIAAADGPEIDPVVMERWGICCTLPREMSSAELRSRVESLLADRERVTRCGWVGVTQPMRAASDLLLAAAPSDTTVLIEGESGTGKELAARAVHRNSKRAGGPFLALNCSAFSETLIESELFGHEKGAFTDAFARKRGVFEAADGGTIFLDEIGETSPGVQARLLRVLEEHQVRPVGASKTIAVDFRIVAATNHNLLQDTGGGKFRRDLYYRLAVMQLTLTPLRERPGDVPVLLAHHIAAADPGRRLLDRLTEDALARLVDYDWPGNARELRNFVERADVRHPGETVDADQISALLETVRTPLLLPVVTGRRAETVEREMIFAALSELKRDLDYLKRRIDRVGIPADGTGDPSADVRSMKQVQRDEITRALKETHGNRAKAARLLGIGERTLYRKIRQFGL